MKYEDFLDKKVHSGVEEGFEAISLPDFLFDFQKDLISWALKKGRSAIFADCGLGKTAMELVWADNVLKKTNKPVLILTPLAVSHQTIREAEKFGVEASLANKNISSGINVINYERLHYLDPNDFSGLVCDESSILKSFDGAIKHSVTEFLRKIPYRLLGTATAAPNDYIELGTSSEALGYLGVTDLLNRFFKNEQNNSGMRRHYGEAPKWRFKGHSELPFWRYICSWARACRKPSDIGYDDGKFILPELKEIKHLVHTEKKPNDLLFSLPAVCLKEQREERKRTINERCDKVAELVDKKDQSLIWCHLNDEGDYLEKIIPDSVQVSGRDSDESKEEKFLNFAEGKIKRLITKPKIGAFGLNFQKCNHVVFFPSHSYEQYYQGVRRCWRFGQKRPVTVDIVTTEGEIKVLENMTRKSKQAEKMFQNLISEMAKANNIKSSKYGDKKERIPSWL